MAPPISEQGSASLFSDELTSEFQSVLMEQFDKKVTTIEAQQIGLRVAQFVFIKEARHKKHFKHQHNVII